MRKFFNRLKDAYLCFKYGRYHMYNLYSIELQERENNKYIPTYKYFLEDGKILWRTVSLEFGGYAADEWTNYNGQWMWLGSYFGEFSGVKHKLVGISNESAIRLFPEAVSFEIKRKLKVVG